MKCWVEASEFDAGILGCELPFDLRSGGIAPLRPAGDLALEGVLMGDAARQALARQDAQLDLSLVQPGAVLGRVVDLEPVRETLGLLGRERLIAAGRGVRVELVQHSFSVSRSRPSSSARMNKAQSLRQRWSVTAMWRQPARGSQARNRLATPLRVRPGTGSPPRCGYRRSHSAPSFPAASAGARGSRPRAA